MAQRLQDKVAIVTGSTSGIGRATAELFAREGAAVVVVGRRQARGDEVVAQIREAGGEASFLRADVTEEEQMSGLVDATLRTHGRIDVLVNNAGRIIVKPFAELTKEDWEAFIALDGYSYFRMMQLVLPHMATRGAGSIVNVTSLMAVEALPGAAIYAFVKAGVTHMSKAVANEYAAKGIRVNCVLPGVIDTEMIADDPGKDDVVATVPMGRIGTAEEQARLILFLASDEASFTTGSDYISDGGVHSA